MFQNSKIVLGAFTLAVVFSSCNALRRLPTSDNDDVYLDPKSDRSAFYKPDEPKPAETSATQKVAAVEDTSNNPYYKDRNFQYDDYYDNQYASRLRRFHNPTYGVGYYDSYYTNSYFYNYNPYQYGVSIYNGYSFWGPSYNNYMYVPNYNWGGYYGYGSNYGYNNYYNNGWSGPGYGYYGYGSPYYNNWCNPFGYNNYGYNNFGYGGYGGYGYGGWYNPYGYNNSYGYNNPYDYNSSTYYGPRVTHAGNNSKQVINPGMDPMKLMGPGTNGVTASSEPKGAAPTDIKRFNQIEPVSGNFVKGNNNTATSVPHTMNPNTGVNTNPVNTGVSQPVKGGKDQVIIQPVNTGGNASTTPVVEPSKPKKGFFNTQPVTNGTNNQGSSSSDPKPVKRGGFFNTEPSNNSGNQNNSKPAYTPSFPSGNGGGGGGVRTSGGGGGGVIKPR